MDIFKNIGPNNVLHIARAWSRLKAYWPALKKLGAVLSVAITVPGVVYSLYQVTQIKDDAADAKRKLAQAEELVTLSAKRLEEARRLSDAATDQAKFTMRLVESADKQLA
jgi:hypothetical protein